MDEGTQATQGAQEAVVQQAAAPVPDAQPSNVLQTPTPTAPENYGAFTMPEGVQAGDASVQTAINEAVPLFKEMGLTQDQAQKLVDLHMKQWKGAADQIEETMRKRDIQKPDAWMEQTRNHPEFGGAKLNENIEAARLAIDKLGGPELSKALAEETGIINHPAVFGAFVKMGRLMKEDTLVTGNVAGGSSDDPAIRAARLYPNMPNVLNPKKQ